MKPLFINPLRQQKSIYAATSIKLPLKVSAMFLRFAEALKKLKRGIATEVPADMAACEFSCREQTCTAEEWETCDQRHLEAEAIRSRQPHDVVQP
jgi:hypothetical protein